MVGSKKKKEVRKKRTKTHSRQRRRKTRKESDSTWNSSIRTRDLTKRVSKGEEDQSEERPTLQRINLGFGKGMKRIDLSHHSAGASPGKA